MKDEKTLYDKYALVQKELITLTEDLEKMRSSLKDIEDLKAEMQGLMVFLSRTQPDFKTAFPEIMKKVCK